MKTVELIKHCRHHGNLKRADIIKAGFKNDIQIYRCKLCHKNVKHNNYLKNKEKIYIKNKKYRKDNPEKVRVFRAEYEKRKRDELNTASRYGENKIIGVKGRLINVIVGLSEVKRAAEKIIRRKNVSHKVKG